MSTDADLHRLLQQSVLLDDAPLGLSGRGAASGSPAAAAAGDLGGESPMGVEGSEPGTHPSVLYRLIRLEPFEPYCFGLIGQGGTFCVNKACSLKHQGGFHDTDIHGDVYVLKSSTRAFVEPSLFAQGIDPDLMNQWLVKTSTLSEWRKTFMLAVTAPAKHGKITAPKMELQAARH